MKRLEPLYLDDSLIVVEKPAGLLAVPGRGADKQDCLSARLQQTYPDALIVHRLDMATSGLMLFTRGAEMQRRLSRLFHDHKVEKRYVAVVGGELGGCSPSLALPRGERGLLAVSGEGWGEIDLPLIGDCSNRPRQKVDQELGKRSLTRYRVLWYDAAADTTRLELEPVTGRTHQLRVHLAAIGHPIVGDALYGGREGARLMLHAALLGFAHPRLGNPLRFRSEPPF